MLKKLSLFIVFFCLFAHSQSFVKLRVIDSDDSSPIIGAKIISNNEVFYTNDDGAVLIPSESKTIYISALSYENIEISKPIEIVKLNPIYNRIEEVSIKNIDVKKIFQNVMKDYDKNYLVKSTRYEGTYKNKSIIDNNIHKLLVADISIWAKNNKYVNDDIDNFVQMGLNNIRYYKNKKLEKDYPYSIKGSRDKNDVTETLKRLFMYNQLYLINFYAKDAKISGKILNEIDDAQEISFKSEKVSNGTLFFTGTMVYNKKRNAITYLQVNYIQSDTKRKYQNIFDEEVETNTNSFSATYDFTSINNLLIPSKIIMSYSAELKYKGKFHSLTVIDETIFQKSNSSTKSKIKNKVNLDKDLIENIRDDKSIENRTLLSKEEQNFINEL